MVIPDPETNQPTVPDDKGVCELKVRDKTFFAKEKDGWAFVVRRREDLDTLPANPAALIGDLTKQYTLAIRGSVKNLPAAVKDKALEGAGMMLPHMLNQWPNETDEQFKARQETTQQGLKTLSHELDEVLVGWGFDDASKALYLDFQVTGVPGTATARGSPA